MTRRPTAAALLVAALAWLATGCGSEAIETEIVAPPVLVVPVESHRIVDRIEATGELIARAQATLAAQVDGVVTEIHADEGSAVETGNPVLGIDPERRELELSNRRAQLAEAAAQLEESEREHQRMNSLRERGAASEAKLDETRTGLRLARARRDAARAQLGMAERALRDSTVSAPFAGLIARRYVSVGEFVTAGTRLVDLVALDPIEVEFHLAERDSSRVETGRPVEIRVAPFPDSIFRATVTVISPRIDPATRTLRVKASVENTGGVLRPGLFARVDLGVSERDGVAMIPEDAVLQRSDGAVAFRLAEGARVERKKLQLGVYRTGLVEVVSGLSVGDTVVVRGQTGLIDGSPVSLRDTAGAPAGIRATAEAESATRGVLQ